MAESAALTKRNADTALMPPPPPPKRIKRPKHVLDEDVYADAIEHIIARDFFPGLVESRAQTEYLDALGSNDKLWIREAGQRLTKVMTPGPHGRGFRRATSVASTVGGPASVASTPSRAQSEVSGGTTAKVDLDMSLDAFQAKYISEDNESFDALLDRQNETRAAKYAFLYNGNKIPGPLAIKEAKKKQASQTALVARPSVDLAQRKASYDGFRNRSGPRNTLMFGPDSVEDTHVTSAQAAAARSLAGSKAVNHSMTRLHTETAVPLPPNSPSLSAIDAAIAGRPRPDSEADVYAGSETPRVRGYAFVDAEPTPSELGSAVDDRRAERDDHEAAMALMPRVDDTSRFRLQDASKREVLLNRLVAKQDVQHRRRQTTAGRDKSTATPRFASGPRFVDGAGAGAGAGQTGNLTPAGRMLAAALGKTPVRSGGFGVSSPARTPVIVRKKKNMNDSTH